MCAMLVRPTHTATLPHAAAYLDTGSVAAQTCALVRSRSLACIPTQSTLQGRENYQSVKGRAPDFSEFAAYMRHGVCLLLAGGYSVYPTRTAARLSACRRSSPHAVCVCAYCAACFFAFGCGSTTPATSSTAARNAFFTSEENP